MPGSRSSEQEVESPVGESLLEAGRSKPKLAAETALRLERRIIEMGWPVGTVLGSESDLMADLNISRAVLREAIRLLEQHQVATTRRGRGGGIVIAQPDAEGIAHAVALYLEYARVTPPQLQRARAMLELHCVASAAKEIDEAGIARLRDFASKRRVTRDDYILAAREFHLLIAELSGNPVLALFSEVLIAVAADMVAPSRRAAGRDVYRALVEKLTEIGEAICRGDEAVASARMRAYLEEITGVLVPVM